MKKIYHLYNENFEITHAQFFIEGEQPENAIFIEFNDFIKAMVNPNTFEIYEGASQEDILKVKEKEISQLKKDQYNDLLSTDWYFTRYIETGQEIPIEIITQRQEIREKYNNLIKQIINE